MEKENRKCELVYSTKLTKKEIKQLKEKKQKAIDNKEIITK